MLFSKRFLDFDSKKSLIEFIIVLTVGSILLTVAMEVVDMFVKSNSIAPTKQYCIEAGGHFSIARENGQGAWRSFDANRVISITSNGNTFNF